MSNIFIYDEFSPEDMAMLQALYSRSPQSVVRHVKKVKEAGSGKFMEIFYVGYGHLSIADCGSTTVFIENISILADKAIQDWPLYSGQETSTRYVDMSSQPIVDPLQSKESKDILNAWMNFYSAEMPELILFLQKKYPRRGNENKNIYLKAISARAFDIMRGFLPAGITTQLSWHTNLRQAWDKLAIMRNHPLEEARVLAASILTKLSEKYPHSFGHENYDSQEKYREACLREYAYYNPKSPPKNFKFSTTISPIKLAKHKNILKNRPIKTNLPIFLLDLGLNTFEFMLDMGSWRDIQRHRNGVCRIPLLTTKYGFNNWYLDELPPNIRARAEKLIAKQAKKILALKTKPEIRQYYIPLGFNLPCKITYGLPASVYTIELRSGPTVHPTLRRVAHLMHHALAKKFPDLLLHSALEASKWDISRGKQDIISKKNNEK